MWVKMFGYISQMPGTGGRGIEVAQWKSAWLETEAAAGSSLTGVNAF